MKVKKNGSKILPASADSSNRKTSEKIELARHISEQFNRMLLAKTGQAELLSHNLEKGLGNEQALRDLLIAFLPRKFGVGKGKVANAIGEMSKQLDVIVYDAINCPTLFVDENKNQILPIEGVYCVIEVKTTLTSQTLSEAFSNLASVYDLSCRSNVSTNEKVTCCPPYLEVFAYNDSRTLVQIAKQFRKLSKAYPVNKSCYSYTEKSPAFDEHTGDNYLISSVYILNKGKVHHMLNGSIKIRDFGEYTLGMFLTTLIAHFDDIEMPPVRITNYLNWVMVDMWRNPDNWSRESFVLRNKE
jgi:hypothetical protein